MFQNRWGLKQQTFAPQNGTDSFHASPTHREAFARLCFLAEEKRRLGILIGNSGMGKSRLLTIFAEHWRATGQSVALISLVAMDQHQMLWQIARQLGLNPSDQISTSSLWTQLSDQMTTNRYQQLQTLILIDDADQANEDLQKSLQRLLQLDSSSQSHLTMVIASSLNRLHQLGRNLLDLCDLRIDLQPWNQEETVQYLDETLDSAGGSLMIFEEQALEKLHELSDGLPRRVNQITDLSIIAGTGEELDQINPATIENAYHELGVPEN